MVGASYLVAFTETGRSAQRLARYRSPIPMLAFTPNAATRSQLALCWGVETFLVPEVKHTDEMVLLVDSALLDIARCEVGEQVVIVAGCPARHPRLDERPARAPDGRRGRRCRARLRAVAHAGRAAPAQSTETGSVEREGPPRLRVEHAPPDELLDDHAR